VEATYRNQRVLRRSEEALQALERLPWTGNVRELRAPVSRIPLRTFEDAIAAADVAAALAGRLLAEPSINDDRWPWPEAAATSVARRVP
jgi:DNA-binding NtrC family response regulator